MKKFYIFENKKGVKTLNYRNQCDKPLFDFNDISVLTITESEKGKVIIGEVYTVDGEKLILGINFNSATLNALNDILSPVVSNLNHDEELFVKIKKDRTVHYINRRIKLNATTIRINNNFLGKITIYTTDLKEKVSEFVKLLNAESYKTLTASPLAGELINSNFPFIMLPIDKLMYLDLLNISNYDKIGVYLEIKKFLNSKLNESGANKKNSVNN